MSAEENKVDTEGKTEDSSITEVEEEKPPQDDETTAVVDKEYEALKQEVANLSTEETADFRDRFRMFDRNGDGVITAKELQLCMQIVGLEMTGCCYYYSIFF
jgi:hypothetical protein